VTRVDVVIPAYNAQAYLGEALDSVLAQGSLVARIIVVDDGSSDATGAVAAARGPPVELVQFSGNRGIAAARNAGLAHCDADFVAFLDADDRWLPGKLDAQIAALTTAQEAALAICLVRMFTDPALPDAERAALLAQQPAEVEGWTASALVARRSLFLRAGVFAEDLRVGETIDWFSRVRAYGHVTVPQVLVERRLHRNNTTRRAEAQRQDYLRAAYRHLVRQRASGGDG
jgi:glycosyltransferase involved in cell wall biosynthesis